MLLRKRRIVPDLLTAGTNLVGIRFPSHTIARALIDAVGPPITATSANVTGAQPAMRAEDVDIGVDCVLSRPKGRITAVKLLCEGTASPLQRFRLPLTLVSFLQTTWKTRVTPFSNHF